MVVQGSSRRVRRGLLVEWTYSERAVFLPTPTTTPNAFVSTTSGHRSADEGRCLHGVGAVGVVAVRSTQEVGDDPAAAVRRDEHIVTETGKSHHLAMPKGLGGLVGLTRRG